VLSSKSFKIPQKEGSLQLIVAASTPPPIQKYGHLSTTIRKKYHLDEKRHVFLLSKE